MTAIVGLVEDGQVWMGRDSAQCDNNIREILESSKIFRPNIRTPMLIGSCGTMRINQVLEHLAEIPDWEVGSRITAYMVRDVVKAIRAAAIEHGCTEEKDGMTTLDANLMIGFQGRLFGVQSGWQVSELATPYMALGSAYPTCYGSLFSTPGLPPRDRILIALQAAAEYVLNVSPPFRIEML